MYSQNRRPDSRYVIAIILLLTGLAPFGRSAQVECLPDDSSWRCYGSFEVRFENYSGPMAARAIHFSNGEFMAEIEQPVTIKQFMRVLPSNLELFSGLTNDESTLPGGNNPFRLFNKAFTNPLIALQKAWPDGPASVTSDITVSDVILENHYPATLSTYRLSDNQISFTLIVPDYPSPKTEGVWTKGLYEPLSDDFALDDWYNNEGISFRNLQEARAWVYKPDETEATEDE